MTAQIRTVLFKILDLLPEKMGYSLYHQLQRLAPENLVRKAKANEHSYEVIQRLIAKAGLQLAGNRMIEIGSGWMPLMPYLMHYKGGAEKIFTYDLNYHYNRKQLLQLHTFFEQQYGITIQPGGDEIGLPDFVQYFPNTNLINADLPSNATIVFSRFVLEHVRPEDILRMHQKLHEDGCDDLHIVHLISPSDHRAYTDASLSLLDFLQYSKADWKRIQTKFDYHNRLRLPQYLAIFEQAGFEVLFEEHTGLDSTSKQYQLFKQLNIHSDFAGMTEEELCAGAINVLLRKRKD